MRAALAKWNRSSWLLIMNPCSAPTSTRGGVRSSPEFVVANLREFARIELLLQLVYVICKPPGNPSFRKDATSMRTFTPITMSTMRETCITIDPQSIFTLADSISANAQSPHEENPIEGSHAFWFIMNVVLLLGPDHGSTVSHSGSLKQCISKKVSILRTCI